MTKVFGLSVDRRFENSDDLRKIVRQPSHRASAKVIDHVDDLSRRFIASSPLAILSTVRNDGILDMTPRGDPPGFVHVLSPGLIAIPDRPGNNRMDTIENLFTNPNIGILFIVPGHRDTLRVSGKGAVVQDAELGQRLAVNGKNSELCILVEVERVLSHCPKAFVRGKVWSKPDWPDTTDVPSLAELMVAHGALTETVDDVQEVIRIDGENRLY